VLYKRLRSVVAAAAQEGRVRLLERPLVRTGCERHAGTTHRHHACWPNRSIRAAHCQHSLFARSRRYTSRIATSDTCCSTTTVAEVAEMLPACSAVRGGIDRILKPRALAKGKKLRPRRDSNPQSPPSEGDALSIRPRGHHNMHRQTGTFNPPNSIPVQKMTTDRCGPLRPATFAQHYQKVSFLAGMQRLSHSLKADECRAEHGSSSLRGLMDKASPSEGGD
jgi:hypothetical protein